MWVGGWVGGWVGRWVGRSVGRYQNSIVKGDITHMPRKKYLSGQSCCLS